MKNQYVGDIGDYGKYSLLRFISKHNIRVGINWYLTRNDGSTDGKFIEYLDDPDEEKHDPKVFAALKKIAGNADKNVHYIEKFDLISGCLFYHEPIPEKDSSDYLGREISRRLWFNNSVMILEDASLIYADPDNGITYNKKAGSKNSEKYILPEEIRSYYSKGKNVVFYCHKGRRTADAWEKTKTDIKKYLPDAQILVITYHRGTQRSYIFVLHPNNYAEYRSILEEFIETGWGKSKYFTMEPVGLPAYKLVSGIEHLTLEKLPQTFSVCKVSDYTGIDIDQPFVFVGRTDKEKSLVCPVTLTPKNTVSRDDGWRAFRICGQLDFSLIGILARISGILASNEVGIFAISTYNTDYILTREENCEKAIKALKEAGYKFQENL